MIVASPRKDGFPRLRAGTFIEADITRTIKKRLKNFPAFGRGLSLRQGWEEDGSAGQNFPAFGRGLSLRLVLACCNRHREGDFSAFGRGIFIAILGMNREVSRGLRSPGLETTLVSRPGLFSLKHEDGARRGTYCGFLMAAI